MRYPVVLTWGSYKHINTAQLEDKRNVLIWGPRGLETFTLEDVKYGYAEVFGMCVVIPVQNSSTASFTKIVYVDDLKIRILLI